MQRIKKNWWVNFEIFGCEGTDNRTGRAKFLGDFRQRVSNNLSYLKQVNYSRRGLN